MSDTPASEPEIGSEVGYGRPPKHAQFQKGKSGNPRGRPKGGRSLKPLLIETLDTLVTIRMNGQPRKVSNLHAIVLSLASQATKSAAAAEKLFKLMDRAGLLDADDKGAQDLSAEDREIARSFLERKKMSNSHAPCQRWKGAPVGGRLIVDGCHGVRYRPKR